MVVLNKIYTRTGDAGETALGDGTRVAKHSARVVAYGTTDELNSVVGIARLHAEGVMSEQLARIQNDLFDLGADLCRPDMERDQEAEYTPLRMVPSQTKRLEGEIDAMNAKLEPLRSFILPGGSAVSAHLHHARAVCRRVEIGVLKLAAREDIHPAVTIYLNRLSDLLFVLARRCNNNGNDDVLWVPGQQDTE